jgi:hypothetical protein
MKWWLVIILSTEIGFGAGEPTYFKGPKPYDTLDECMKRGEKGAQWLHQDFVTVTWKCVDHDPRTTEDQRFEKQDPNSGSADRQT